MSLTILDIARHENPKEAATRQSTLIHRVLRAFIDLPTVLNHCQTTRALQRHGRPAQ